MNLQDYYKYYLSLHQNVWCRRMHVLGQLCTIAVIVYSLTYNYWCLLIAPFVVYPFAWSGHYFFEKNEPAAFKDPIKAKISDWIMLKDWILGRLDR